VIRVVDADTVWLHIELGLDVSTKQSVRLFGINAPEMSTPEGKKAREFVAALMPVGQMVLLQTIKDKREKYGRYLGVVVVGDTVLNDLLVQEGHAVPYDGRG
jgi:micrococcal nuclease